MSGNVNCGNPGCDEPAKLKCSACSSISYCTADCQKKHWSTHKSQCKAMKAASTAASTVSSTPAITAPSSSSTQPQNSELVNKLNAVKSATQQAFSTGKFEDSIKHGEEALELAKKLPPPVGMVEVIQIMLNLSNAYMQLKKPAEAEKYSTQCLSVAEAGMAARANHPPSIEVVMVALNSRVFILVALNRVEEAEQCAVRSLAMAESIYPKSDPRMFKSLQMMALIRDKQDNVQEAEKHLLRAYTILSLAIGPLHADSQRVMEELIGVFVRRNDIVNAERYAIKNLKSLKDKAGDSDDVNTQMMIADSSDRLAQFKRRLQKFSEAEPLLLETLELREKKLGPGHIGVAYTLANLCSCQEALGKFSEDLEKQLMRATEIFGRAEGQGSQNVMNLMAQLRRVRAKRLGENSSNSPVGGGKADNDSDDDVEEVYSSGVRNTKTVGTGSKSGTTPAKKSSPVSTKTLEEELESLSLKDNDPMSRMMHANRYFEEGKYNLAEVMLGEAYSIFSDPELGGNPESPNAKIAKQNLLIARSNALNQLWMSVVTDQVLKLGELDAVKGNTSSDQSTDTEGTSGNAYANLMNAANMSGGSDKSGLSFADEMWLKEIENNNSNQCTIC